MHATVDSHGLRMDFETTSNFSSPINTHQTHYLDALLDTRAAAD